VFNYGDYLKLYILDFEKFIKKNDPLINEWKELRNSITHNHSSFPDIEQKLKLLLRDWPDEDRKIFFDLNNLRKALDYNDNETDNIAHYKENGTVRVKIKIPSSFPPTKRSPRKLLNSLLYLLPKKFREEYIGDLLEDRENLKKRGLPKWKINLISFGNILCLLIISRWIWFQGFLQSTFKYFKEFIQ
jgi:hypothetical protein